MKKGKNIVFKKIFVINMFDKGKKIRHIQAIVVIFGQLNPFVINRFKYILCQSGIFLRIDKAQEVLNKSF